MSQLFLDGEVVSVRAFFGEFVRLASSSLPKWILIASLCAFSTPSSAANVTLKLFVLSEIDACPPDGYSRESETPSCQGWSADQAEAAFQDAPVKSISNIPPDSTINLGSLSGIIRNYARNICLLGQQCPAENGQSVLILFEWDEPQTGTVSFARVGNEFFSPRAPSRFLSNEQRWVDHQRADAFFPIYGNMWKLTLNGQTWTLTTK